MLNMLNLYFVLLNIYAIFMTIATNTQPYQILSQLGHDVRTTSFGCCHDIKTSKQHRVTANIYDIISDNNTHTHTHI